MHNVSHGGQGWHFACAHQRVELTAVVDPRLWQQVERREQQKFLPKALVITQCRYLYITGETEQRKKHPTQGRGTEIHSRLIITVGGREVTPVKVRILRTKDTVPC